MKSGTGGKGGEALSTGAGSQSGIGKGTRMTEMWSSGEAVAVHVVAVVAGHYSDGATSSWGRSPGSAA